MGRVVMKHDVPEQPGDIAISTLDNGFFVIRLSNGYSQGQQVVLIQR
jgi:hypothetical protein